jgi:hypothetical protein
MRLAPSYLANFRFPVFSPAPGQARHKQKERTTGGTAGVQSKVCWRRDNMELVKQHLDGQNRVQDE